MQPQENQQNTKRYDTKQKLKLHPQRLLERRLAVIGVWTMIGRQADVWFAVHIPSNSLDIA